MSNPTYSSDPADPRDVPAYDPSQGGPGTVGYDETPAYTDTPTYSEPPAADPYAAGGNPYVQGAPGYSATNPVGTYPASTLDLCGSARWRGVNTLTSVLQQSRA